jgi:hypothetical protein
MVPLESEQGLAAEGDSGTSQDLDELPAIHPALHRVAADGALGIVTPDGCRRLRANGFPAHASEIATSGPRRPNPSFVRVARDALGDLPKADL